VKIMAGLNIAEKRLPQDGRIRRKIAGKEVDMRVATVPTAHGERITIRLLDRSSVLLSLDSIGMGPDTSRIIRGIIHRPHGIFLVTGPTGSGKTTTLYAALSEINAPTSTSSPSRIPSSTSSPASARSRSTPRST
jgi:general secretion pathway protein E